MNSPSSAQPEGTPNAANSAIPLELFGIAHRFGRRWVLRGLDLSLASGEVAALIGPNGAGKTTLLRVVATLLRPLRGTGRIGGIGLLEDPSGVRGLVSIIGHSPALYEDLTPVENLRFAFAMHGERPDADRIRTLLAQVGLSEHTETRVRRFSAGMRRRVAVARILAFPPHLLLMDEPYSSLDSDGITLVNRTIRLVANSGGAVLIATHDMESGSGVVRRVIALEGGLIANRSGVAGPVEAPR